MDKPKRGSSSPLIPLSPKHSKSPPSSATHVDNRMHKNLTSVSCMESPSNSPKPSSQSGRLGIHRHSIASDVSNSFVNGHNRSTRRSKESFSDRVSNVSACSSARSFDSRKTNETSVLEPRKSFSHSPVKFPDKVMRRVSSSPLSQQQHSSSRVSHNSTTKASLRIPKKSSDEVSETGCTDTTPRMVRRSHEKPPRASFDKNLNKQEVSRKAVIEKEIENGSFLLPDNNAQFSSDNIEVGLLLLKMAQALHTSGENPLKARFYALKAAEFFENFTNSDVTLELVISLHLLAASCCKLGQYEEAIPVLKRSLSIFSSEIDPEHALAAFAGYMQLGDTYSLVGQYENALNSYHAGLEIQKLVLGVMDPQVSETCRYIAESHLQVMQFAEAEELCDQALNIHGECNTTGTLQEAADRRLMALILSGKGDHEGALQNLVLASAALLANGKEIEVAFVDCSIGDSYVALGHHDEAIFSYHKALSVFKSEYGEGHTTVASVYASLADLYLRTGKFNESKNHCENALIIYGRQGAAHYSDEIATGLTEIAGLFESMGENKQALSLLQKALEIMENTPGQQSAVGGIEAQMGVLFYLTGKYEEAYMVFNKAISKLRFGASKKTWLLGMLLNQMGLACIGLNAIWDAAENFEEARSIMEEICGRHHADTLAISSNLAGTYDAMGRVEDAITLLEDILEVKEDRLGTVHPDVEDERQRLTELLKETGRSRSKRTHTLQDLLLLSTKHSSRFQGNVTPVR
ncbi:hypothetical protein SUGI_0351700 [Cryptomeria japonica]|uniref:protein KINESIN LIGHT CHAIN-RELATED 1 n=1 Tax=Cryptomeria japonica TaxID=3369 RepID=UPI002408A477|nr:protein KINESIN LIGHT CHAIN-RELATED 1 [Cryptomeria japonica]GLJ19477.1 hypothetical protein SUGI_0351700 [Cryptomeria japonica]